MSLSFAGVEKASPTPNTTIVDLVPTAVKSDNEQRCYSLESHTATALKPSDVIELQKYVSPTVAKQQRKSGVTSDLTSMGASQGKSELVFNRQGHSISLPFALCLFMYMYMIYCNACHVSRLILIH